MRHTPLFEAYKAYPGIRLIDFGGWELPVHFEAGILSEHAAVRTAAGMFDVSHMGEILLTGGDSESYLQWLVSNDVSRLQPGKVLYTLMCYPDGGVVDDLIIYRLNQSEFLLVVNASNIQKDFLWMTEGCPYPEGLGVRPTFTDMSDEYVQIAIQGPKAEELLTPLCDAVRDLGFFDFSADAVVGGIPAIVSRTGYTGEDGFEIYVDALEGVRLWDLLLEQGRPYGMIPCGLGARDTLRVEARLPLYGHEISPEITPLEANLGHFVAMDTKRFCGWDALEEQRKHGIPRTIRGITMVDKGVPRQSYLVYHSDGSEPIGSVTSGIKSPTLDEFCGYVIIPRGTGLGFGDLIEIEIHGKRKRARLVKTPFYKNTGRRT